MLKRLLLMSVLCLVPMMANAQTPAPPTSAELLIFAEGVDPTTGTPIQINSISVADMQCNLDPVPVPTQAVSNPRYVAFDDPFTTGRMCQVDRQQTFFGLPLGMGYRAVMRYLSSAGPSPRSAASNPFNHVPVAPAAPTNVGVR